MRPKSPDSFICSGVSIFAAASSFGYRERKVDDFWLLPAARPEWEPPGSGNDIVPCFAAGAVRTVRLQATVPAPPCPWGPALVGLAVWRRKLRRSGALLQDVEPELGRASWGPRVL
jgi:hypothetical protein